MEIRKMRPEDWEKVKEIYLEGIETGLATFETEAPGWEEWNEAHLQECRIIAEEKEVLGWAALSPVSDRCVYGGVGEVSVYVSQKGRNKGIGLSLLNELVRLSEEQGLWTLQSGIFSENTASIRVHEKAGFRIIGLREKIGKFRGEWKDNVLMERRSTTIGRD